MLALASQSARLRRSHQASHHLAHSDEHGGRLLFRPLGSMVVMDPFEHDHWDGPGRFRNGGAKPVVRARCRPTHATDTDAPPAIRASFGWPSALVWHRI